MMRFVLATQQAPALDDLSGRHFLDMPLFHQFEEPNLIDLPVTMQLLVLIKQLLRWRQSGQS
jgi:hypothetical protein